jgi:hypothetical protein
LSPRCWKVIMSQCREGDGPPATKASSALRRPGPVNFDTLDKVSSLIREGLEEKIWRSSAST